MLSLSDRIRSGIVAAYTNVMNVSKLFLVPLTRGNNNKITGVYLLKITDIIVKLSVTEINSTINILLVIKSRNLEKMIVTACGHGVSVIYYVVDM